MNVDIKQDGREVYHWCKVGVVHHLHLMCCFSPLPALSGARTQCKETQQNQMRHHCTKCTGLLLVRRPLVKLVQVQKHYNYAQRNGLYKNQEVYSTDCIIA
jgi:hypothetical protein